MSTPTSPSPDASARGNMDGMPAAVFPDDPGYDAARAAWNLAADLRPAAVVTARTEADVIGAVQLARMQGLRIAPIGTGHMGTALPDLTHCILLRTAIGGVEVDAGARRVRVGAGALWQEVVDAVTPHGLAALSGSAHDVGVVGYTLGGGLSWLAREYGMACNHVRAIELVTAEGQLVRADALANAELFWALRGGGANFGVVTAIEFELFPITEVLAGMTVWPATQAREVLRAWARWSRTAADAATTALRILRLPPLPDVPPPLRDTPVVVIDGAVLGDDPDVAAAMVAGFRGVGTPMMDTWSRVSPAALLEIHMDPPVPVPARSHTALLSHLDEDGIDEFLMAVGDVSPLLMAELRQLGGALGRRPAGCGARADLDAAFLLLGVGMPMGPDHEEILHAKLTDLIASMRSWSTDSVHLGFDERGGTADTAFDREALAHLKAIRRAWDPHDRFTASHRITQD